jgi:hypothetical protein
MNISKIAAGEYLGHKYQIEFERDDSMGPPWQEHDGHGPASDWTTRDKRPGELVLCSDRHSRRFYDYAGAMELAKKDGWGLSPEHLAELTRKLGRKPTAKQIAHASVMADFDYLRQWCNDEWEWTSFSVKIVTPDGRTINAGGVGGFDGLTEHCASVAADFAKYEIEQLAKLQTETEIAACFP